MSRLDLEEKGRVSRLEERLKDAEARIDEKSTKRGMKFLNVFSKLGKRADKNSNIILVMYLTSKYQVEFKVCRIVSGNIVVIDNKAHVIDPKNIWRHKKINWYILREIDRRPVSNRDYNLVKKRRDDTEADEPLIKAVLGAVQKKKGLDLQGKNIWIIIIIAIIAVVVFFTFFGGGGTPAG